MSRCTCHVVRPACALGLEEICTIKDTAHRGIRLVQLRQIVIFVSKMATSWYETYGSNSGAQLAAETVNLYQANVWLIKPATKDRAGRGCSLVEAMAVSVDAQTPSWFVSHAWVEPICKFEACLEQHAHVRELAGHTSYWVCAYANNQHDVEEDIANNPRCTSFYRAMQKCQGVILILDKDGTPFERIWCCFEETIVVN